MTPQLPVPPQPPAPLANASATPNTDVALRWIKEAVASLLGIVLVVCLVVIVREAFEHLGTDQAVAYQRIKDLLLFINPLVGVVIGYYFNRVVTEARAENAERTAQGATTTALQAAAARDDAQAEAQLTRAEADEIRSALDEVLPAAQEVLAQLPEPPPGPLAGVAGGGAPPDALREARLNLRAALERARAVGGGRGRSRRGGGEEERR